MISPESPSTPRSQEAVPTYPSDRDRSLHLLVQSFAAANSSSLMKQPLR